ILMRGPGLGARANHDTSRDVSAKRPGGAAGIHRHPHYFSPVLHRTFIAPLRRFMAEIPTAIVESLAFDSEELPFIAIGVESQAEDTVGIRLANLTVRLELPERAKRDAAGADDKLANTMRHVEVAVRIHWCEPLVVVVVAREDEFNTVFVEGGVERIEIFVGTMFTGAPARLMPVREGANRGIRFEIFAEPLFLLGAGGDVDLGIQDDDVPDAKIVAVVPLVRISSDRPKVVKIRLSTVCPHLVVTDRRHGAIPMLTPGRVIAILEFFSGTG